MSGRFDVGFGNWLPEDCDSVLICECPNCGQEFYEGDEVVYFDGEIYCDNSCMAEHIGAINTEANIERDMK